MGTPPAVGGIVVPGLEVMVVKDLVGCQPTCG